MTEDTKAKIKRLADEYAHCYAFVGDDTMPLKRAELHAAIDSIDARGEAAAWMYERGSVRSVTPHADMAKTMEEAGARLTPLYAAPLCASQDGFVPRGFICPQCHLTRVIDPKCPDCNYDADAHSARQDGGGAETDANGDPIGVEAVMTMIDGYAQAFVAWDRARYRTKHTEELRQLQTRLRTALAALRSPLPGRESTAKPLDDPRLQELFSCAIDGALTSGYQGVSPAPEGHWLAPWWQKGRDVAGRESTAQAGIAQSFGPVINPPTVLTTTAQAGAGEVLLPCPFCGTVTGLDVEPACVSCSVCLAEGPIGVAERLPGESAKRWNQRAAAPNVLAMREALQNCCVQMERARSILTGGNPRPDCNWGMLDTTAARAALASPLPVPRAGEAIPPDWYLRTRVADLLHLLKGAQVECSVGDWTAAVRAMEDIRRALAASPIPTPEPQEGRDHDEARDARRWRTLPALLEKYQINYMALLRDIDATAHGSQEGPNHA